MNQKETEQKKIAFILFDYPIGVSSMVVNSIKLFLNKGFSIDIYTNLKNLDRSPIEFPDPNIRMYVYDDTLINILLKVYRFIIRRTGNLMVGLSRILSNKLDLLILFPHIYMYSAWLSKRTKHIDYSFLIPVEFCSLVVLDFVKNQKKIIYFNMELMDWADKSVLIQNKLIWKNLEYRAVKRLSHVTVPSPIRAEIFSKINNFEINKIFILPVASMGDPIREKSRYFRDEFGIPEEQKIVIYSGNFRAWAKCLEIIQSVPRWLSGFALVMHTWNSAAIQEPYFLQMKEKAKGLPVYFSARYIDYQNVANALSSADIGLAFYENIDKNFSEILFSSNKIGEYLKAGLAIICSDFHELKKYVEENKIGFAIPVGDLPLALSQINPDLEKYRFNAIECYQNKYRFEKYFGIFYNSLFKEEYDTC